MAPPNFPQGMTLHTIGYSALKYPDLPAELNVPLNNQVGVLQRVRTGDQNHMIAQIASQYLPALLDYQTSNEPHLLDPSSPQYYFSTAICLLNFLSSNPDVCIRVAKRSAIIHDLVEKMLAPDFEVAMRECKRPAGPNGIPAATFEDDFGSILQFLSTILLYSDHLGTMHPRIEELIPKLRTWKQTYRRSTVRTISNASDRLVTQIQGLDPALISQMREMQAEGTLVCGFPSCGEKKNLNACGSCKIQRYCGQEHQKKDWRYHKVICGKGLEATQ